jgi:hypothetical protein
MTVAEQSGDDAANDLLFSDDNAADAVGQLLNICIHNEILSQMNISRFIISHYVENFNDRIVKNEEERKEKVRSEEREVRRCGIRLRRMI